MIFRSDIGGVHAVTFVRIDTTNLHMSMRTDSGTKPLQYGTFFFATKKHWNLPLLSIDMGRFYFKHPRLNSPNLSNIQLWKFSTVEIWYSYDFLQVRNVDELDSEIAPAIFRYGQRHYHSNAVSMLLINTRYWVVFKSSMIRATFTAIFGEESFFRRLFHLKWRKWSDAIPCNTMRESIEC